jgi:dihydroorotate dehydrogenase (fumarate)
MNISTVYLGMRLRSPLVPSASPLSGCLDNLRRMEEAGAGAVVLHSLFEEQIRYERYQHHRYISFGAENYPEALGYFPDEAAFQTSPEQYLELIRSAKEAVEIPVIASLNGSRVGGWLEFAPLLQQAGADALELNIYHIPTDPNLGAAEIERGYLDLAGAVNALVTIPLAVKLNPFFTGFAHFARRLDEAGVDGLVLFNRFYQPDVELETRDAAANIRLSTRMAMRLPLTWISILHGRVGASLAATSGIDRGLDALKLLMAGADVTMVCSALLRHGIGHLEVMEKEMRQWMEEHEHESVEQLKGSLTHQHHEDPSAFERAQYLLAMAGGKPLG